MAFVTSPRATTLGTLTSVHRALSAPLTTKASLCTSPRPVKQQGFSIRTSRPGITARIPLQCLTLRTVSIRNASSVPTASPTPPQSNQTGEEALTWNRFFDLRKKRRYINLVSSIFSSLGAVGVVAPIIAQQDIDAWGARVLGLEDPVIVLGISTFAIAAGGWLCGPSFGSALFGLWAGRRGWNRLIAEKEKSFFARIKRYRADPSSSSPQNPIPDYYGEKIASVKDYRRWLKDQRAFNLKKDKNFL